MIFVIWKCYHQVLSSGSSSPANEVNALRISHLSTDRERQAIALFHCGPEQPKTQTKVVGHSLVFPLVHSHHSLVRLLCTTRFARALHCTHSFACSLTSLTPLLMGKWLIRWQFFLCFSLCWTKVPSKLLAREAITNGAEKAIIRVIVNLPKRPQFDHEKKI